MIHRATLSAVSPRRLSCHACVLLQAHTHDLPQAAWRLLRGYMSVCPAAQASTDCLRADTLIRHVLSPCPVCSYDEIMSSKQGVPSN